MPISPDPTLTDQLVHGLMQRILDGTWPPGVRLPPERELAALWETSRTSVRDALKRLGEWGVVQPRQGSGVTVLPQTAWSIGALGAALRHELGRGATPELGTLVADALGLRRSLVLDLIARAAQAAPAELGPARTAVAHAWAVRHDSLQFAQRDVQVLPLVLAAANMPASVWMLNSLSRPYLDAMAAAGLKAPVPPSYVEAQHELFDAVSAGQQDRARSLMSAWLDLVDAGIVASIAG